MTFAYVGLVALLVFGFGFVIFWHELGHFLAAKWAGVEVEQFAVGFGQAIFSWRKGLGIRRGTSRQEYEQALRTYLHDQEAVLKNDPEFANATSDKLRLDYAAAKLGMSETEYRLNWIPLGGYVKMLGQDDLDPNSKSDAPSSYNNRPVGKRMVIVSAGVIMNIILAVILFTLLFRIGFSAPPPVVGSVVAGSPAQEAGVKVGDRVLKFDGDDQFDFNKIMMSVALVEEGEKVPLVVKGVDGKERNLMIAARKESSDSTQFLRLGIEAAYELRGPDAAKLDKDWDKDRDLLPPESLLIQPDDQIVAINGQPVEVKEFYKLDEAMQTGEPVKLTVRNPKNQSREVKFTPRFSDPFGSQPMNLVGMVPRASIMLLVPGSAAIGKLKPGDDVISLTVKPTNDTYDHPSPQELRDRLLNAAKTGGTVDLVVLQNGVRTAINDLTLQTKLETGAHGLGIGPGYDSEHPVVGAVMADSASDRAKLPPGSTIISIAAKPVNNWYDMYHILREIKQPGTVQVVARADGVDKTFDMNLTDQDIKSIESVRFGHMLALAPLNEPRQTKNPVVAASWGITETRDLIVQFYITIRRMMQGSIAPSNAMGPIGIFHQGSKIANRGMDWVIWFLAMISANLAVVNFLPIPIVDGGLFLFLILEKIMGKPLSPKAQSIAQFAGLALIGCVFLFVTYHDIARMF